MVDEVSSYSGQDFFADVNTRIRDLEEKQRILKDRMVLVGEGLISERDKSFLEIQEMKRFVVKIKEENIRIKELLQRVMEKIDKTAMADDLMILQRQLDILRGDR
jgi:vacuolar-type H+-ATPase subunit B/Vma2